MKSSKKRVIIIGGGFGGLSAAKSLAQTEFEVFVFDKTNHHLFQPLLYQVATAALSPGDIAVPIRETLSKAKNVSVFMSAIKEIDLENCKVITDSEIQYSYDYLIIAVGARHSYFGKPEWEQFAPGLKSLNDALSIRNRMLKTFEQAELEPDKFQNKINFVVVGAGPTGVEMAGAFAEIAKQTLANDFRNIDPRKANVFLIEAAPQILGMYPQALAEKAQLYLEELGVTVLLNTRVTDITNKTLTANDQVIETENIIWAAGNQASPLLTQLEEDLDQAGRVKVTPSLNLNNHPNVFVIGDAAHVLDKNKKPLPGLAPVAAQQGKYVGQFIKGITTEPFNYFDKGSMATIGKSKAVLKLGSFTTAGFFAWIAWCFVHILFLIDFRNRLVVFTQWIFAFVFSSRGVRLINNKEDKKD